MLEYSVNVAWSAEDEEFVAISPEFPRLSGLGDTRDEAVRALEEAMDQVLAAWAAEGRPAPNPVLLSEYSGQFRVRLPKSTHAALAARAASEDVSLNALLLKYVEAGLASDRADTEAARSLRAAIGEITKLASTTAVGSGASSNEILLDDFFRTNQVIFTGSARGTNTSVGH